jgi:Tol biopolymer transport system component
MNAGGSEITNLTPGSDELGINRHPFWSPDGEFIYFETSRNYELGDAGLPVPFDLYRMRLDGSDLTRLFYLDSRTTSISISPDGQFFLYDAPRYAQTIAVRRVDTLEAAILIEDPESYYFNPVWSPDGRSIAFFAYRSGLPSLMVADADGSHQQVLWTGESNTGVGKLSWLPVWED